MKASDEAAWQGQLAEFARDGDPNAAALRDFLIAWADNAKGWLQEAHNEGVYCDDITSMESLRATLRRTETQLGGIERISIGFIGMALTLLSMYWEHGKSIYDEMTPIEQHLVEDTAAIKLAKLAQQAQEAQQ